MIHPQRGRTAFAPYGYQQRLLYALDDGGPVVVLKARQTGISTTLMLQKLRRCIQPGVTVLVVSRKEDTAKELLRIAREAYKGCDPPFPVNLVRDNALELGFDNGSRIIAESATENTGRTFAASDVVFDEFAFLPWQEEMWRAIRPTVSRGSNICVVSTPDMEGDLFHSLWLASQVRGSEWEGLRVHWRQCPEYTVSDTWYNANRPDYTTAQWGQEFECEFGFAADAVFKSECIQRAIELAEAPYLAGSRKAVGGDLAGQGRDETVLLALDYTHRPARLIDRRSWEVAPAPELQRGIEEFAALHGAMPWLDRTGIGWGIIENLSCAAIGLAITGGNAETGTYREPNVPRTLLINNLVMGLEQEQLTIPHEYQELIMGLRSYRWDKAKGRHADWVDALAIAWWAAQKQPQPRRSLPARTHALRGSA